MSTYDIVPATDPSKVLVVGDTHGNTHWWVDHVIPLALRFGVDGIVQVGDFGFWHGARGERYLDAVNQELEAIQSWCLFVDGNHENFDLLYSIPVRADGFREVRPRIVHAPRGHRWSWSGVRFLALGGGASIDKQRRTQGESWWPQEQITKTEAKHAIKGGPCDVMLTHDAPLDVPLVGLMPHPPSQENRLLLQSVLNAVSPRILLHGHLHHAYRYKLAQPSTLVVGLNCDGTDGNCVVADLHSIAAATDDLNEAVKAADGGPIAVRPQDLHHGLIASPRWESFFP
jgi:predicted phosphodiesterase